ncbi:MAG TPA: hypothetical protein VF807_03885 [Ktedonobacterales bacterium]
MRSPFFGNNPLPRATIPPLRRPNFWLRIASISPYISRRTLERQNLARRSDLIAWLCLGLLIADLIVSPIALDDTRALVTYLLFAIGIILVVALNRAGLVTVAGVMLVALVTAAIFGGTIASPIGLTMGELPNYDAMAVAVVVAATVLPRVSAFIVAGVNSLAIVLDYLIQPHNQNLIQDAKLYTSVQQQAISLLVRPIALHFMLAIVAFLWVRGIEMQMRRADYAEELAEAERRELESSYQMEEDVRHLLHVFTQIEHGDLRARVPQLRTATLARIAASMNNMITYLEQNSDAPWVLRRTDQAASRVAATVRAWHEGREEMLPPPSGTMVDAIIVALDPTGMRTSVPGSSVPSYGPVRGQANPPTA